MLCSQLALLVFLVIIPLCGSENLYAQFSYDFIRDHFEDVPYLSVVCTASAINFAACHESTVLRLAFAVVIIVLIAIGIVVVSYFRDAANRDAWINKKVRAWTDSPLPFSFKSPPPSIHHPSIHHPPLLIYQAPLRP